MTYYLKATVFPELFSDNKSISLLIICLLSNQPIGYLLIMPKHHFRIEQPLKSLYHIQTLNPRIVIPRQPPMRMAQLIILLDMKLICREDEGSILLQIHLQDAQSGRMARRMMNGYPLEEIEMVVGESLPIQLLEIQVVSEVDPQVRARCHSRMR